MISKDELAIKKGEIFLNYDEVQELLEYSDTFKKYLTKSIHRIQAQLGSGMFKGKEQEAYIGVARIQELINGLDGTSKGFQKFLDEKEKAKKKK